jgi:hypothetical protein
LVTEIIAVHAARLAEPEASEGVLRFDRLTALAYQRADSSASLELGRQAEVR